MEAAFMTAVTMTSFAMERRAGGVHYRRGYCHCQCHISREAGV